MKPEQIQEAIKFIKSIIRLINGKYKNDEFMSDLDIIIKNTFIGKFEKNSFCNMILQTLDELEKLQEENKRLRDVICNLTKRIL